MQRRYMVRKRLMMRSTKVQAVDGVCASYCQTDFFAAFEATTRAEFCLADAGSTDINAIASSCRAPCPVSLPLSLRALPTVSSSSYSSFATPSGGLHASERSRALTTLKHVPQMGLTLSHLTLLLRQVRHADFSRAPAPQSLTKRSKRHGPHSGWTRAVMLGSAADVVSRRP
jgi:hypothetical protein